MKMLFKFLITDAVHEDLISGLIERGFEVDYRPDISLSSTKEIIPNYQGLIINSKILADADFMERGSQLKCIARLGSGMEIIDTVAASQKGIHVINTPEANCNAVAEHALGMLLSLFRNLNQADRELRKYIWDREKNRGTELSGKTIGIIGYGHTGQRFEELLRGFDVKILVYDKYKQLSDSKGRYRVVPDVNEIKDLADVISLHLPLTEETKFLVNMDFIRSCRNPIYIINTSRGDIVKTEDLIKALHQGKVKGACLDVFENEKPKSFSHEETSLYQDLYAMDNVLLSPHIAGWTFESKQKIAETLLNKLDCINFIY
jgi:D-3-phosphoglycerate dehydrogenase / 2-oxoglutarate reductase